MLIPKPQGDSSRRRGFEKCLGHEAGALMKGINALIKETPWSSQPLLPHENSLPPGRGPSPEPAHTNSLILDFQAPEL